MMLQPSFRFWYMSVLLIFMVSMFACYDYTESEQFRNNAKYKIGTATETILCTDNYTIEDGFLVVRDYCYWSPGGYRQLQHNILRISTSGIIIEER